MSQPSDRDQLSGTITSIRTAGVLAEVAVSLVDGLRMVAVVTCESVESLGLAEGVKVDAIVRPTEVIIARSESPA